MTTVTFQSVRRTPLHRLRAVASGPLGPFVGLGSVLAVLVAFEWITEPVFASSNNLVSLARAAAIPLLLSAAMALVLLTGGVDLSIGSTLALCGTAYAKLVINGCSAWLALLIAVGAGFVIGFVINGLLIGRLHMSFFVVTLGTLSLYRGLVYLWTDSRTIDMFDDGVSRGLGDTAILSDRLPIGILVSLAVVTLLFGVLTLTTFGRSVYAVGGNREAAELSGVRSGLTIATVYSVSGACAALAGVMTIGRTTIADPNMGAGVELQAAAAALLGGVALSGGVGSIWGAVLGMVFLQVLSNALALAGMSAAWQLILTGGILIVAVYLDRVRSRVALSPAIEHQRERS